MSWKKMGSPARATFKYPGISFRDWEKLGSTA